MYYHPGLVNGATQEMDSYALTVFQMAFPGKIIIGIDSAYLMYYDLGAIHCAAMTLPSVPWT
jgi:agmatine/peptidylarginine deiminase